MTRKKRKALTIQGVPRYKSIEKNKLVNKKAQNYTSKMNNYQFGIIQSLSNAKQEIQKFKDMEWQFI